MDYPAVLKTCVRVFPAAQAARLTALIALVVMAGPVVAVAGLALQR
jgi:hypothetical protein